MSPSTPYVDRRRGRSPPVCPCSTLVGWCEPGVSRGHPPDERGPSAGLDLTCSCLCRRRLDQGEVADGEAVVLPLLLEDHVQAVADGLGELGGVRVLAL